MVHTHLVQATEQVEGVEWEEPAAIEGVGEELRGTRGVDLLVVVVPG
jgi:hypothetical protein